MAYEFPSLESILYKIGVSLAVIGVLWCSGYILKNKVLFRVAAWYFNRYLSEVNVVLSNEKHQIFKIVQDYQESLNKEVNLLDVRSGPAANLKFIPQNAKLVCLDTNPYYAGYIDENIKKEGLSVPVEFVKGCSEEMPFKNETFDVVVCTMVLCIVTDIEKTLEEIKRVLKPGGKFVFLEHLPVQDKGSSIYVLQLISSLMAWLVYSCHDARDTEFHIKQAGFSDLRLSFVSRKEHPPWARLLMIGSAKK